ncbi:MAG TPA: trehalose-6-phosphate synthase [Bacteroidetes bacterium]|nr:trehalose-6-phosphate synthase [Bacteroidota bacterium]
MLNKPDDDSESVDTITRIVAVSNRLPIKLERVKEEWRIRAGGGGLVTAMAPVLRNRGGIWIGWSGTTEEVDWRDLLGDTSSEIGYDLHTVTLTRQELEGFYEGFSNDVIWPMFHDLQTRCKFAPDYWYHYLNVNGKFSDAVEKHSVESDFIWVHDYHLIHLAQMLRMRNVKRRTGFFLHIPFPSVDIFLKMPWRAQILQAMTEYDLIGFQTLHDRRNFIQCLQFFIPNVSISGRGAVVTAQMGDRSFRIGSFPISIDYETFARDAATPEVLSHISWLQRSMFSQNIALGVDRLDYTKGLPERLHAFGNALERYPELRKKLTLIQVVVPSRITMVEYQALKAEVEQLVGEINGKFTRDGWIPIHYLFRNLDRNELLAYYRAARIGLVTPLKDGMNLVSKEYCTCNIEEEGVLILSEFAGSASQFHKYALLVNPHDIEGTADAIYEAYKMPLEEKKYRMHQLREIVKRNDIYKWVDDYLQAALSKQLNDFPSLDEYVPQIDVDFRIKVDKGK